MTNDKLALALLASLLFASGCDGATAAPDGSVPGEDAGPTTGMLITAAEGGSITSADGVLTLYVLPGSIDADTRFSITTLARADWPSDLDATTVAGEIYRVEPSGTVFDPPAVAAWTHDALPAELVDGDSVREPLATVRSGSVAETPSSEVHFDPNGEPALVVLAEVPHLSDLYLGRGETLTVSWILDGAPRNPSRTAEVGAEWDSMPGFFDPPSPAHPGRVGFAAWASGVVALVGPTEWPMQDSISPFAARVETDWTSRGLRVSASTELVAGGHHELAPLPRWRCAAPGTGNYSVALMLGYDTGDRFELKVLVWSATATCVEGSGGPPLGDEILVGDTCETYASSSGLSCDTPRSTAAAVAREPAAVRASYRSISPSTQVYESPDPAAPSEPGPAITLETSRMSATATHDGTRYQITDVASGGAFAATDALTVTSGATTITVDAPPSLSDTASRVLGEREGLRTQVHFTDGQLDGMYVHATLSGSSAAGPAGLRRYVPATEMALEGDQRTMPLLDDAAIAALAADGLSVETVTVGPVRRAVDETIFSAPVAIVAGRFVQVDAGLLEPPGPIVRADCTALPADFPDREAGGDAVHVCITETGGCHVTNDVYDTTDCVSSLRQRALTLGSDETGPIAGRGWRPIWSSNGTISRVVRPRLGVDESVILQHEGDGRRMRIALHATATGYRVDSVAPFTDAVLPPYGASFDCAAISAAAPLALGMPHEVDGVTIHARVCIDSAAGTCFVHGDLASTPENEECLGEYAAALGRNPLTAVTFLQAGFPMPADGGWQISYSSAGTSDGFVVTDLPGGTTIQTNFYESVTSRWNSEYRFDGVAFTFTSIVRAF